jgi:ribosome-binding protein aMBF1 (putative translation factor)
MSGGGYDHQDWTPVVIRSGAVAKAAKQQKQNAPGTKEFHKLDADDIPKLDKITPELQNKLRAARNAKGLSQTDLAKTMNIPVAIIKDYENGTVAKFNKAMFNRMLHKLGAQGI